MPTNPTIVAASLDDKELRQSIANLVAHVKRGLHTMKEDTTDTVAEMQKILKQIGTTSVGGNQSNDSSKRTESVQQETRSRKELITTLDKQAAALRSVQQVNVRTGDSNSIRNADTVQTMNIQLDLLRERLREARNQYSSFVALAAHATTTGDRGLFQFATEGVHRYEEEVRSLIPQIRTLQSGIKQMGDVIAPQGHTIQNYVNSLQKTNPELAQLNERFKRGASLLQTQKTTMLQSAQAQQEMSGAINITRASLDKANAYMAQSIQREQQFKESILQTGLAARETANQLIKTAHEQASLNSNAPISGYRELTTAFEQMRRAYFQMSGEERLSPIGKALEQDIKRVNEAITAIGQYNRSLIGGKQQDRHMITNESSVKTLKDSLKELTKQYNELTAAELNAGKGDAIIRNFQNTTRAAQLLQKTLSRPLNLKEAMAGDERTLDDLAYKIQRLKSYKQGINITDPKQVAEIKQVDSEITRLTRDLNKYMNTGNEAKEINNALSRSWNYMKNRLAFYFTVGASTQFIKNLIEVRAQYEMNERALGILIGSAERGTQIFNELSQMALVSPYTLIELSTAAKQLTAYDVAAKDVVDTTRRLADMASAVGIPIERLTYALGQIKAYGYLNSRDQRMFANAGIPLVKQLADYYTELEGRMVSTADVYDKIKKKAVGYNDVMQVIGRMTDDGGKFFDFQAKMADALKVRLANLTLAWNNMLNDIGKSEQGVLTWGIGALRDLFLHWKDFDKLIKDTSKVVGFIVALRLLSFTVNRVGLAFGATWQKMALTEVAGKRLAVVMRTLAFSMKALVTNPLTWWMLLATAALEAGQMIFGANEAMVEFNKSLREGAENNFKDISQYLDQYKDLRSSLYAGKSSNAYELQSGQYKMGAINTPTNIDEEQATKAWEAMREQIELSTASSNLFIGQLLQIENVSERLRVGFKILDDIQQVNSALKDMGDDTIKITQDWSKWWNLWAGTDGIVDNIKDVESSMKSVFNWHYIGGEQTFKTFGEALDAAADKSSKLHDLAKNALNDYDIDVKRLQDDVDKYTDSLNNFIKNMGFASNPTQVAEVYNKALSKFTTDNALSPQQAYIMQQQTEAARSEAVKEALSARIADETQAIKLAQDERTRIELQNSIERNKAELEMFNTTTDTERTEWARFTQYMKENHISEMQAMFRDMDAEQIKSINWQDEKYQAFIKRSVESYAKRHKMSYDEAFEHLRKLVNNANMWSIFISLTISTTDKKSLYDTLKSGDDRLNQIDTEIERLKRVSSVSKDYVQAQEDINNLEKERQDLIAKGSFSSKEEKRNAKAARSAARAASKAQREAETELQKAIKSTLQLIDKERSVYKRLTKEGVIHTQALTHATEGYESTIANINKVLGKYGVSPFDPKNFIGTDNPALLLKNLQNILNTLKSSKLVKPEEIKDLELKEKDIKIDNVEFDAQTITKSLNSELDKLKDEYELAIELDANPELSQAFASALGLVPDTFEDLPNNLTEYSRRLQNIITTTLNKEFGFIDAQIPTLWDWRETLEHWAERVGIDTSSPVFAAIKKVFDSYRETVKKSLTNTEKMLDDYVKKYGDYSDKIAEIEADRLRKIKELNDAYDTDELKRRPEYGAKKNAIESGARKEMDKAAFEEFKNSRYYIAMFENLEYASTASLNTIRQKLLDLKDSLKDLSPEQLKWITQQFEKIDQELLSRNPFKGLMQNASAYFKAIGRAGKEAQKSLLNAQKDYDKQLKVVTAWQMINEHKKRSNELSREELNYIAEQAGLESEVLQYIIGEFDINEMSTDAVAEQVIKEKELLDTLLKVLGVAEQANEEHDKARTLFGKQADEAVKQVTNNIKSLGELRDFLKEDLGVEIPVELDAAIDSFSKAGEGMEQVVSSIQSGNFIGAITGAAKTVYGFYDGIASLFGGGSARDRKITKKIQESERMVKRLELSYKRLEDAADKSYGAIVSGAQRATIANKELQLVEIKRQLELEKSRKKKKRDEDKIIDLQGQYEDLVREISNGTSDIVNELLGISSAGDGIEKLVQSMIDSFKSGEDAMEAFGKTWDEMIDNMVLKLLVTTYMQKAWDKLMSDLNKREEEMLRSPSEQKAEAERVSRMSNDDIAKIIANQLGYTDIQGNAQQLQSMLKRGKIGGFGDYTFIEAWQQVTDEEIDAYRNNLMTVAQQNLDSASIDFTKWSLDYMKTYGYDYMKQQAELLKDGIGDWYTFGQDNTDKQLSALQQGIQGITEDTAGALEAYMNGVSQQVYLHSDLLTQIRDAVVGFDMDVQTASLSQILLQLQSSYQVQMSIQGTLEGWSNPSGQAVRVEMVN